MSIKIKPFRILAIDPGPRYFGLALFDNNSLTHRAVKTIQNRKSTSEILKEVEKMVLDLIDTHAPDVIVQEKPHYVQTKTSEKMKRITAKIKQLSKKNNIIYQEYSPAIVKRQICQIPGATKKDVAQVVSLICPDMSIFLKDKRAWKDRYIMNLFDAVALGLCYIQKNVSLCSAHKQKKCNLNNS